MNPSSLLSPFAAVLAMLSTVALLSGVVGLFGQASQLPWLTPTDHHVAMVEHCHAQRASVDHRTCLTQAVATAQRAAHSRVLADSGAAADSARAVR